MDFNALWSRASAAASEVATAAQEQASRAAAAAQEQAELFQSSEAFASIERAFADIAANTVAVAEQSERNFQAMLADEAEKSRARALAESAPKAFGVDEDLEEFLRGFTKETFAAFPLDEAMEDGDGETDETGIRTAGSRSHRSPWRQTHARLVVSKVPAVRELRDSLVPDTMRGDQFWKTYFALCAPRLARVEARAAAAVARSRARRKERIEAEARANHEEKAPSASLRRGGGGEGDGEGDGGGDGGVNDSLRRELLNSDVPCVSSASAEEDGACAETIAGDAAAPPPVGDLDAYLADLLGGSSDDDEPGAAAEAQTATEEASRVCDDSWEKVDETILNSPK
jgi:hypothetical protein